MRMKRDPVCGMSVSLASPRHDVVDGSEVVFCSAHCRERFATDPSRYQSPDNGEQQPAATKPPTKATGAGAHTRPMHPDVRSGQPGPCPICGMALEPRGASLAEAEGHELREMKRRLWLASAVTVPLLTLAQGDVT